MAKLCNRCGKEFDVWDDQEDFGIDHYFGYGSKHDMEHINAHFCCKCFDDILDQIIPQLNIPMDVEEYTFINDVVPEE